MPPLSSSTVTLSRRSKPAAPPTTTDSSLFLDRTNMMEPPCSGLVDNRTAVPDVRGYSTGEQEHLDDGSGREDLHNRAGGRFDLCPGFTYVHAGDSFDLLPKPVGGVVEQLAVKV